MFLLFYAIMCVFLCDHMNHCTLYMSRGGFNGKQWTFVGWALTRNGPRTQSPVPLTFIPTKIFKYNIIISKNVLNNCLIIVCIICMHQNYISTIRRIDIISNFNIINLIMYSTTLSWRHEIAFTCVIARLFLF